MTTFISNQPSPVGCSVLGWYNCLKKSDWQFWHSNTLHHTSYSSSRTHKYMNWWCNIIFSAAFFLCIATEEMFCQEFLRASFICVVSVVDTKIPARRDGSQWQSTKWKRISATGIVEQNSLQVSCYNASCERKLEFHHKRVTFCYIIGCYCQSGLSGLHVISWYSGYASAPQKWPDNI